MKFNTEGLILKSQTLKDDKRLITVLTRSKGVIRCFVRDKRLMAISRSNAIMPLTYSRLTVFSGRDSYILDDAAAEMTFFEASAELSALAVAQYFCELCMFTVPEGSPADEILNLTLNSLYMLSKGTTSELLIKAVFELRLMALSGYTPDILACSVCGEYEADLMYFLINEGKLVCASCGGKDLPGALPLSKGALYALRHSILAEPKKIFSFSISPSSLAMLADCAEGYVLARTERSFGSLDYYKKVALPLSG